MPYARAEDLNLRSRDLSHLANPPGTITTIVSDIMSFAGNAARLATNSMSTPTFDISWNFALCLLPLSIIILRAVYQAYGTNLRDTPGPWQARFTRLWLLRAISSRSFHRINLDLHRRYGSPIFS